MRRHSGIWVKFFLAFLLVGLVSLILTSAQMFYGAKSSMESYTVYSLDSLRNIKKSIIEDTFNSLRYPLESLAVNLTDDAIQLNMYLDNLHEGFPKQIIDECFRRENIYLENFYKDFQKPAKDLSASGFNYVDFLEKKDDGVVLSCLYIFDRRGSNPILDKLMKSRNVREYLKIADKVDAASKKIIQGFGISNILLINNEGTIFYSYEKSVELGANVFAGHLAGGILKQSVEFAFNPMEDDVVRFFDFSEYLPYKNEPAMFVSVPMKGDDGYIAVLVGVIPTRTLDKIVSGNYNWQRDGFGKTGDIGIVGSKDGIFRTNQRGFIENQEEYFEKLSSMKNFPKNTLEKIEQRENAALILRSSDMGVELGEDGHGYREVGGYRRFLSHAKLDLPDVDWRIIVGIDEPELYNDTKLLFYSFTRSALSVVVVVIILTVLLAYVFTKPIRSLRESFVKIAEGNMKAKVVVNGNDEFRDLSESFNLMLDKIEEHSDEIERANEMLQEEIAERREKEVELQRALDRARQAEKAKGEFLANMSHEIRTPLNGILGFLNLLKQTKLQTAQLDYLRIIDSSTESLLAIINEILDFSKIESGKMMLENIEFALWQELEQLGEIYSLKAREKKVDLAVHLDTRIPNTLMGDPLRIRQIMSNLLSNSIKFTNEGGMIVIAAAFLGIEEGKCKIRISVKDNGIGISKEKQSTIFSAFSQEDSSVTRKYGGTGLGLAICSKIAGLMGSQMQLDSEKGVGSEFYFILELPFKDTKPRAIPNLSEVTVAKKLCNHLTCSYLNIDKEYLEPMNCKIEMFDTIEDLKSLEKIDVIFMGCNNYHSEIIDHVEANYPHIPRIYVSCPSEVRSENSRESTELVKYIHQPMTTTKIISIFSQVLKRDFSETAQPAEVAATSNFEGTVLLVEDNPINMKLAQIILEKLGLKVDTATNGQIGVEKFKENQYDIIFMDIHMPVMDGVSATREIRLLEKARKSTRTPIIALTANVVSEEQEQYVKAGMDGFLAKPIEHEKLVSTICLYLASSIKQVKLDGLLSNVCERIGVSDQSVARRILQEFYNLGISQIGTIRRAVENSDAVSIGSTLHSLKSAAVNLGFKAISHGCENLENAIEQDNNFDIKQSLTQIEIELERIKISIG